MGVLAILVGLAALAVLVCGPGHGARGARSSAGDPLGLGRPAEIVERREALESEDLAQLLEVCNARRRRRGEPERTVEDVELELANGSARRAL